MESGSSPISKETEHCKYQLREQRRDKESLPNRAKGIFDSPCDLHRRRDGRPAGHTKAQCHYYRRLKEGDSSIATYNGPTQHKDKESSCQKPDTSVRRNIGQFHTVDVQTAGNNRQMNSRWSHNLIPTLERHRRWTERSVVWSRGDHPPEVKDPGQLALVVTPQVAGYRLNKVLMDGGGRVNILYQDTLRRMNIPERRLQPTWKDIQGIIPGITTRPIGKITLEVSFGTERNFRTEFLSFEVVAVKSPYHAIFGREAYVKFTARPCYVYLQLKIPGPNGVITVHGDRQSALECEETGSIIAEEACIANSSHGLRPSVNLRSPKRVALGTQNGRTAGRAHQMVNSNHTVANQEDNTPGIALIQKQNKRWRICIDPISINNPSQGGPTIVRPYSPRLIPQGRGLA